MLKTILLQYLLFHCRYYIVLTGASFFNHRYLQLYHNQPQAVHIMVDKMQSCEDIAMSFVVALYLKKMSPGGIGKPSGVYVHTVHIYNLEKHSSNGHNTLWDKRKFGPQRSYCVNKQTERSTASCRSCTQTFRCPRLTYRAMRNI